MDIRYGANPVDSKNYDTKRLRDEYVIQNIFQEDKMTSTYSHIDRVIVMGVMPISKEVFLEDGVNSKKNLGVEFFLERRELGVINIGGEGTVTVDGSEYKLKNLNGLYVGKDSKNVSFKSTKSDNPAKFYMTSAPAHTKFETKLITMENANKVALGDFSTSNKRVIYQFIHPDVLETCQLSMGCTVLDEGCVWNSMPCHTHERRMEVYFYFNLSEENAVFHFMGEPKETRSIIIKNEEAIISPSWSIHAGCGTSNYSFIWAMAGENRVFTDMDHLNIKNML